MKISNKSKNLSHNRIFIQKYVSKSAIKSKICHLTPVSAINIVILPCGELIIKVNR